MAIGRTIDNFKFYNGFEGETDVIFQSNITRFRVWEGYLDDIFAHPPLDGKGWSGLARDYNQMEGPFLNGLGEVDPKEYLDDLKTYTREQFDDPNDKELLFELIGFFQSAVDHGKKIMIEVS